MKETGKQLISILSKALLLALLAFPVLAVIDYFTEGTFKPYTEYKRLIGEAWTFIVDHWEWTAVVVITPILCRGAYKLYAPLAEEIRQNQFEKELIRWLNTPYISPLHHLYMIRPPRWVRWEVKNPYRNTFYKFVVQAFRDIVYRPYDYQEFEPTGKRPNVWQVVPKKAWVSMAIYMMIAAAILTFNYRQNSTHLFDGYYVFTIPLLLALLSRVLVMIIAIVDHAGWKKIDRLLIETFGEKEPKTRWVELFPNQSKGKVILETWKAECRLRQDRDTSASFTYENPAIPNCPYPEEQIPSWATNYDAMYYSRMENYKKKQQETISTVSRTSGKVIPFDAKRKKAK